MEHVLVQWSKDWADEFNTDGFIVTTKTYWDKYFSKFLKLNSVSFYFGTNEGWEDEDPQEFARGYTVSKIDKDQVKTLIQLFGKAYDEDLFVNFGTFPLIEDALI